MITWQQICCFHGGTTDFLVEYVHGDFTNKSLDFLKVIHELKRVVSWDFAGICWDVIGNLNQRCGEIAVHRTMETEIAYVK